mgnify:FL=1
MLSIDILNLPRIDLIKMDVEGMEIEVLDGASESIAKNKPIMLVEILKTGRDKIVDFFKDLNYEFFIEDINLLAVHKNDPVLDRLKVTHSEFRILSKKLWQQKERAEALDYYLKYLKYRKINKAGKISASTPDIHLFHPNVDKPKS